ncbi:MAG: hypothetical protein MJ078_00530 [Clostridia bacterium]|nr:hypothetical protein [Clostridia bacterium]
MKPKKETGKPGAFTPWAKGLCLVFASLLFWFSLSCGGEESSGDLIRTAEELCLKSAAVNEMLYGEMPVKEDGEKAGVYREIDPDALRAFGVSSCLQMTAAMREVYADKVCLWMVSTLFSPIYADNLLVSAAKFYDNEEGTLFVNAGAAPLLLGKNTYSDFVLLSRKRDTVTFSCTVSVTYEGKTQTEENAVFTMVKEKNGYRLAEPTYKSYTISEE